ncbi:hypothetical protein EYF80_008488 [Liparis tanakae]|uniref:Uncharacterized protein n=1 Tax=Liparis tanakae TaxID=230148 RepID=A0A4Z2IUF1_9TELE|nr:hypothetical protein EYF80_008488 [Liparis tanakae]
MFWACLVRRVSFRIRAAPLKFSPHGTIQRFPVLHHVRALDAVQPVQPLREAPGRLSVHRVSVHLRRCRLGGLGPLFICGGCSHGAVLSISRSFAAVRRLSLFVHLVELGPRCRPRDLGLGRQMLRCFGFIRLRLHELPGERRLRRVARLRHLLILLRRLRLFPPLRRSGRNCQL